MYHMFDVSVAEAVGVNAAIVFQNIAFWCQHSEANGTNYHDGAFWTYNSNKAFHSLFPYMSENQIRTAITKLLDAGLIVKGNYNKAAYDRTMWYTVTEAGKALLKNHKSICEKSQMEVGIITNGFVTDHRPIPDINPDINITDINPNSGKRKRFVPPTVEEVKAYAKEKGWTESTFPSERFVDYYESKGWMVGKTPMRDWKAAARGWVSRQHQEQPQRKEPQRNAALDYEQRDYSGVDESSFYTDLDALLAEGSE